MILARDSGKGVRNGSEESEVAKLVEALNALSVGVQNAAQSLSVRGDELCEVLAHLEIVPGQPASSTAIQLAQAWAGLEEQEEIAEALRLDSVEVLTERAKSTFEDESNPSDDEVEQENGDNESMGAAGGTGSIPPPSYAELSPFFGPLEKFAASCGNYEAGDLLRKARMSFIADHASERMRQAGFGEFAQE